MTVNEVTNIVIQHPLVQAVQSLTVEQKTEAIKAIIPLVINEIGTSYEWDFSTKSHTEVTVADQSVYTFTGSNNDAQGIINVYYDDTVLLQKLRPVDADAFLSNRTVTGIGWWTPAGRATGGFPKVKIINTPSDAGENLTYRYFIKMTEIGLIPDQYGYVIVDGVLKSLFPELKYQFDRSIKKMIDSYNQEGNDPMQQRLDPDTAAGNNRIARLYGW